MVHKAAVRWTTMLKILTGKMIRLDGRSQSDRCIRALRRRLTTTETKVIAQF